jgi:predicted nucleic acid-binding protein
MAHLVVTSILGRLANRSDPQHGTAANAVFVLQQRGADLRCTAQVLIEFRNVATRPTSANGLGLSHAVADVKVNTFEMAFSLLSETPGIFPAWKALVQAAGVIGKQVHDARLVAVCQVHAVDRILTFNVPPSRGWPPTALV